MTSQTPAPTDSRSFAAPGNVNTANRTMGTAQARGPAGLRDSSAIGAVSESLESFGTDYQRMESQSEIAGFTGENLQEEQGHIAVSELTRDSAKLTAIRIRQQLSAQSLAIANARPQSLLGLFSRCESPIVRVS